MAPLTASDIARKCAAAMELVEPNCDTTHLAKEMLRRLDGMDGIDDLTEVISEIANGMHWTDQYARWEEALVEANRLASGQRSQAA